MSENCCEVGFSERLHKQHIKAPFLTIKELKGRVGRQRGKCVPDGDVKAALLPHTWEGRRSTSHQDCEHFLLGSLKSVVEGKDGLPSYSAIYIEA
eukprot:6652419-Lingulodinium_polyedra.AAC.1